jgi:hypothetical protein
MKKAIEKAIENKAKILEIINAHAGTDNWELVDVDVYMLANITGYALDTDVLAIKYLTESNKFYREQPSHLEYNFTDFVFNTDFIDKLVGDKYMCAHSFTMQYLTDVGEPGEYVCEYCVGNSNRCKHYVKGCKSLASYYKEQLANMTTEERIKYINKITEV